MVTLTDGTVKNLGKVTGSDGVGIAKMEINSQGELLITLTDGTQLNAGLYPRRKQSRLPSRDSVSHAFCMSLWAFPAFPLPGCLASCYSCLKRKKPDR